MSGQQRHESPELGDAIVRMMRGLVTRASDGDTEAIEQLQRIEQLAPVALTYGLQEAHEGAGYSWTQLGDVLGVSRQSARERGTGATPSVRTRWWLSIHQLAPGHTKRGCVTCSTVVGVEL